MIDSHQFHPLRLEFSLSCFVQAHRNAWLLCSHYRQLTGVFLFCTSASFSILLHHCLLFVSVEYPLLHLFASLTRFSHTTCHPSIINTPTHIYMHAYTHVSVAAKGRPNASFDAMALWALSWYSLLLCSSIIHCLHIACVCVFICAGALMWSCSCVRKKKQFAVRAPGQT